MSRINWAEDVDGNVPVLHEPSIEMHEQNDFQNSLHDVDDCVKIDLNDIQPEVDYWSLLIICFVIGANPPTKVFDGFINRY